MYTEKHFQPGTRISILKGVIYRAFDLTGIVTFKISVVERDLRALL